MALVKSVLEAAILAAFEKQAGKQNAGDDPAASRAEFAADLAEAINLFIQTGTVNSVVTGTSPGGPVTGTAVGTMT